MADLSHTPQDSEIPTDDPASIVPASGARHRIALIKGQERWQFRWDRGDESTLINHIAELARDPDIPFDWFDAAVVCKHIAQPFGSNASTGATT